MSIIDHRIALAKAILSAYNPGDREQSPVVFCKNGPDAPIGGASAGAAAILGASYEIVGVRELDGIKTMLHHERVLVILCGHTLERSELLELGSLLNRRGHKLIPVIAVGGNNPVNFATLANIEDYILAGV